MKWNQKHVWISSIITLVIGGIYFYIVLPPLHLQSLAFYLFLFLLVICFVVCNIVLSGHPIKETKRSLWAIILAAVVAVAFFGSMVLYSPLFRSGMYAKRITIDETGTFASDVPEVDFDALPLLDRDSTEKLGDRVMGQMAQWVSQFYVSDLYTQINYQDTIIRATPLEYNGMIKWFTNRGTGVPAYITVNSVNGEATLHSLDQGMRYMPSAMFHEDLNRKLRFSYPFDVFGTPQFELDEAGKPFWIVPTYSFKGIGMLQDVNGVIILDPVTGASNKYAINEVPTWVDHVFPAELILEQVNDWGQYREGFINSMIGQKNVVATTEGYNYLAMNDDVYLYTGITSVLADESNLGFILCNMRTKETHFYAIAGAEEFSAMSSAMGQVQQMNYQASFPLLINLEGKPTYVMSLKDNAGLVKMYAFVDVQDYQKVVVTNASEGIIKAAENYLGGKLGGDELDEKDLTYVDITVQTITMATVGGNSYYYISDDEGNRYKISIQVSDLLPFVKAGDVLQVGYLHESDVTELIILRSSQ